MRSYFYTKLAESPEYTYANVRRWTKRAKVDLFSRDLVIVPINEAIAGAQLDRWAVGLINLRQKRFHFIASKHGSDGGRLAGLRRYLKDEHQDKKGAPLDLSDWEDVVYAAADGARRLNAAAAAEPAPPRANGIATTVRPLAASTPVAAQSAAYEPAPNEIKSVVLSKPTTDTVLGIRLVSRKHQRLVRAPPPSCPRRSLPSPARANHSNHVALAGRA